MRVGIKKVLCTALAALIGSAFGIAAIYLICFMLDKLVNIFS